MQNTEKEPLGMSELKARQAKVIATLLRVLANENRLMILCALMDGPMGVSSLAALFPHITQSALSQHLALMKAHSIVDSDKNGLHVSYRLSDPRTKDVISVLREYYCPDKGGV